MVTFSSGTVLTTSVLDGWTVVDVVGDVEWAASCRLRALLLTTPADSVVVDLSHAGYVDHYGLGVLVRAHRYRRARGGKLRLVAPPRSTLALMRAARAYDLPSVHDTRAEAMA